MLECVINISEGKREDVIGSLSSAARFSLVDVHSDPFHNRSVFTLYGKDVIQDSLSLTRSAFSQLDLASHSGAHPRFGVVDVVPFVPLETSTLSEARVASMNYASQVSSEFNVPVFLYDHEVSLPEIRKYGFSAILPAFGPNIPHARYGAIAVGTRDVLVAYNLYLRADLESAKNVARLVRSHNFRTLGLQVGERVQLSANLIDPINHGIAELFAEVNALSEVENGELVGLAPASVIEAVPRSLWEILGLSREMAIEAHIGTGASGSPIQAN